MKLMVIGYARHGKDTLAEILRDEFGLTFQSSSYILAEEVVRPYLKEQGLVYPSLEACYADRVHHRSKWFDALRLYNADDATRLMRLVYSKSDLYVGCRSDVEFYQGKEDGLFDLSIWVDACDRLGVTETTDSNKLTKEDADIIITNNEPEGYFRRKVSRIMRHLL